MPSMKMRSMRDIRLDAGVYVAPRSREPVLAQLISDVMSELQQQDRSGGHLAELSAGQVAQGIYLPARIPQGIRGDETHDRGLAAQHHAPGKPMTFLGPAHVSGIQVVTQRNQELQGQEYSRCCDQCIHARFILVIRGRNRR